MPSFGYRKPPEKLRARMTPALEAAILEELRTKSQQQVARELGVSQTAVGRIARRHPEASHD